MNERIKTLAEQAWPGVPKLMAHAVLAAHGIGAKQ